MVHLLHLQPGEKLYDEVANRFRNGWQHPNKTSSITDIFYVIYEGAEAQQHLAANRAYLQQIQAKVGQNAESYLFHGTQRACYIGENAGATQPCNNSDCHLCSVIKCSFQLKYIGEDNMFGKGFYTSDVSSKADFYARNFHIRSHRHAMFLGNVVTGQKQPAYRSSDFKYRNPAGPDAGFDSVEAITKPNGGEVEYPETIVFREDAILPSIVVMYTRTGWHS